MTDWTIALLGNPNCGKTTLFNALNATRLGYEKGNRAYREKLLSMGLTPGTHFTVTRQAPMGDPIEVEVRGFKLSLRKGEAATLQVETLAETSGNRAEITTETITPGERSHD